MEFGKKRGAKNIAEAIRVAKTLESYEAAMDYMSSYNIRYVIRHQLKLSREFTQAFMKPDISKYGLNTFNRAPIDKNILSKKIVIIVGDSNMGKTSYALAHFTRGAVIQSKYDYCKITVNTDGIVFDMKFNRMPVADVFALCNLNVPTKLKIKYGTTCLQPHIPRIVCVLRETDFWPYRFFERNGKIRPEQESNFKTICSMCYFIKLSEPLYETTKEHMEEATNCGDSLVYKEWKLSLAI
jgi:hypothetical protein